MEKPMDIEIYAIAVGVEGDSGVGTINHQLEIITESDILHLPISANILSTFRLVLSRTADKLKLAYTSQAYSVEKIT